MYKRQDIREIQPQQLLDMTGLSVGEPFLICGGPPCQPFSTAGKRLGINDPRGSLFMDFIRMIDYIRPRFFVMENVKGIMSSPLKHVPLSERDESDPDQKLGTVLDVILAEFDKLGYKTVYGVLDAVNYGVPQFRERFVLIGSRDNEDIFLPIPTHFQMHQSKEYQWQTVRSVIEDLESDHGECATLSEERLKFLKMVPEGGNWRDLPENIIPIAMGGAYKSGGGKVGFYRRSVSYTHLQYLSGRTVLNCSDEMAAEVAREVMQILKDSYAEARRLLTENRESLDKIDVYKRQVLMEGII